MTKLRLLDKQNQIPAGIFSGVEAFWYENQKWVIAYGSVKLFDECEPAIQQTIYNAFNSDKESLAYLAKMRITNASELFDRWYQCVVGGLDSVPDFNNNKLNTDTYNNMCSDNKCPHRGRLCSRAANLKNYEIETIQALKTAKNMDQVASSLCVSLAAIKSRIAVMHEKMGVTTTVGLIARAAELGI